MIEITSLICTLWSLEMNCKVGKEASGKDRKAWQDRLRWWTGRGKWRKFSKLTIKTNKKKRKRKVKHNKLIKKKKEGHSASKRTLHQGRIQDLGLGGAWVGEGSGDRLRSPAGPGQSPSRGSRGAKPLPPKLWGFEELQTFIWTTILNQPHHFYKTK